VCPTYSSFFGGESKKTTLSFSVSEEGTGQSEESELGGLFRVSRPEKSKKNRVDATDCSRFHPDGFHNWDLEEVGVN